MTMTTLPPGYLPTREAAGYLGYQKHTLECWRSAQVGPPFVKLPSGRVYYQRMALDLWLRRGYDRGGAR